MNQAQLFWEEALEDLNKRVKEAEVALKNLQDYQLDVERRVRENSFWKLHGHNWGGPYDRFMG